MRILHTSDWHLGKKLFKIERTQEHILFLNWLVETLIKENIDLLLIAGDVFDSPNPPHEALELFYHFLHRLSVETKIHTFVIAGNHDSGPLLEAPSRLLLPHRVKIWGKLSSNPENHWIEFEGVDFCAIPFFRSHELLPQGHGDLLTALASYFEKPKSRPQVLMLHHLAGKFESAGSEQVISLSGVDSIPTDILEKFDYVALGHIHKPQKVAPKIYYSGSPIPLRFSETIKKSVVIIEKENETLTPKILPIPSFRDLKIISTNEADYQKDLMNIALLSPLKPMAEVQIELSSPMAGLIDEVKSILDKQGVELLSFIPVYLSEERKINRTEKLFNLSTVELFDAFYKTKYPEAEKVPDHLKNEFLRLMDKVKNAPPEA
jgi:exonuclease SbcD